MKKAAVVFSAAAVMAMTAVSVPTPVEARGGWGWGPGIAGGLIAGALIGGLASNAYGYGPGYGYYGPGWQRAGPWRTTNPCIRPSNGKAEYARKLAVGSRPCGRPCRS